MPRSSGFDRVVLGTFVGKLEQMSDGDEVEGAVCTPGTVEEELRAGEVRTSPATEYCRTRKELTRL